MEGPLPVDSDKQMLEQLLVNLLSNAVYAVKEKGQKGGRIEIKTASDGSMVEIRISDNGPGIPEKNQKQMYDLFFTTKPPGKGTGLGLPICQNIIRKLGGNLSFDLHRKTACCIIEPAGRWQIPQIIWQGVHR